MQQALIYKVDLANLKSYADKLYFGKLKNVPTNFSNLKSKVDKFHVDKLVPFPADLSKLRDVAINDVVKKDFYTFKILIFHLTNLTTTTALTAVQYKIPNVAELVKRLTITQNW